MNLRTCIVCGVSFHVPGADHKSRYCPAHAKGREPSLAARSESDSTRRANAILADVERTITSALRKIDVLERRKGMVLS